MNEAVEAAHLSGILTAASLMVTGKAAADAVARARALPRLGVGLHIVLTDGTPALPPSQIPALVGKDGRFCDNMVKTAFAIALFPAARAQMRAEIAAQFALFAATGLHLDHVNAHKHFHLHPMIAAAIVDAGRAHGLAAIRMPYEPGGGLMAWWAQRLGRRWRARGLLVNDRVAGLSQTGAFTPAAMQAALARLTPGLTEIYTHPATRNDWPEAAAGYAYGAELAALTMPAARDGLARLGVVLGNFAEMAPAPHAALASIGAQP